MITKMNKYSFLIYHKEYETFLDKLRELGVVHIEVLIRTYIKKWLFMLLWLKVKFLFQA